MTISLDQAIHKDLALSSRTLLDRSFAASAEVYLGSVEKKLRDYSIKTVAGTTMEDLWENAPRGTEAIVDLRYGDKGYNGTALVIKQLPLNSAERD